MSTMKVATRRVAYRIVASTYADSDYQTIAKHVMRVHMNRQDDSAETQGEIDVEKMKRYIAYCKRYGDVCDLLCTKFDGFDFL